MLNKLLLIRFLTASLSIFVIAGCLEVQAQESTFEESALRALINDATGFLKSNSHRVTTRQTFYENGSEKPVRTETTTRKLVPPDSEHAITEKQSADGVSRSESIRIGNVKYVKTTAGVWEPVTGGYGTGSGIGSKDLDGPATSGVRSETTEKRIFRQGEIVNGQSTTHYETIKTMNAFLPDRTVTVVWRNEQWFNPEMRLVKSRHWVEIVGKSISETIHEYEYDPNIKVEAPVK